MKRKKAKPGVGRVLRPYRKSIVLLSCLTVLQSLLQVVSAVLMRSVIDAALGDSSKLAFWGVIMIADMAALVIVHGVLTWYASSATDRFTAQLRYNLLHCAMHSRDEKLHSYHSGALLNRGIEDVNTICDGAMYALPAMVGQIAQLVATFAAVFLISPPIAAVLTATAVVIGGMAAWLRPIMKRRHRLVRQTEERMSADMQEDLQQLELIQSLQMQKPSLSRFDRLLKSSLHAKFKRRLWSVGSNGVINAASQLGTGVLLLWGAGQIAAETLSYGSLTSMLQLLLLFRSPVLGLTGLWTRTAAIEVAGERLLEMLSAPEEPGTEETSAPDVRAIVFENVTFAYPGEETPVLRQFNARFVLEDWSCLTGISGKGKTTLFKLILGLYDPQEGRVYLDTDRGEILCSEHTRYLFAYVPQDYALFSGTVRENLEMAAPDADDAQRRWALQTAQADFVWELTAGEQTHVRENNNGLSKGQLQRLAIARAILMDRPIFLLDECTSALDSHTEDRVLQQLKGLGKQAVLVTHRPAALEGLDGISKVEMAE
jgi:ATP-binding cassette subfamily B protein